MLCRTNDFQDSADSISEQDLTCCPPNSSNVAIGAGSESTNSFSLATFKQHIHGQSCIRTVGNTNPDYDSIRLVGKRPV